MINSLAQIVLKIVSPGVPDFYQGAELWDLSLVDPDNRRPVDYALRQTLLAGMQPLVEQAADDSAGGAGEKSGLVREMLEGWRDGRVKLYSTACGLRYRRELRELFLEGDYLPLEVVGECADHVVALARTYQDQAAIAIVPRLVATLTGLDGPPPLGSAVWKGTQVKLPPALANQTYRNIFSGELTVVNAAAQGGGLPMADVLAIFPVAILHGSGSGIGADGTVG